MRAESQPHGSTSPAPSALGEAASYYHAALLLGLCRGDAVVAWADQVIATLAEPPVALAEVALTDPRDLTALRRAVQPLAHEPPTPATLIRLLGDAAHDLTQGRRSVADTVSLFAQMRRMLTLPSAIEHDLDHLQDTHMLAVAGVQGSVGAAEKLVWEWLAGFGAAARS